MGGSLPPEGLIASWRPTNLAQLITQVYREKGANPIQKKVVHGVEQNLFAKML
jgi:hypothetical protein